MDYSGTSTGGSKSTQDASKKIQQSQAQVEEILIIHGYSGTSTGGSKSTQDASMKIQQSQAQVEEVVGIMRVNVEKVLERDQKLSELDYRADALQQGASQFEQQAGRLKRKMWWKNVKMMIIMGVIGATLLIIIIVWIWSGGEESSN